MSGNKRGKPPAPAAQQPTEAKAAQIKPAADPAPSGANTTGKILPKTAPQPATPRAKARTKAERDRDIAQHERERREALQRGDRAAAEAADLKIAQVMDEPKVVGDVVGEAAGILGTVLGGLRGRRGASKALPKSSGEGPKPAGSPPPARGSGGVYSTGSPSDCGVKPYKDQKCPEGQQAHHIVPDYALRYGSRGKGAKGQDRIPGMPSLDDGPSICLTGQARKTGGEHNAAHEGTDPKIAAAGQRTDNGGIGVAPIGEIIEIAVEEVSKVKPHCTDEIKRKTDEAFKDVDRSKYGRTTQQPPKKGTEARATLERGDAHQRSTRSRRTR